MSFSSDLNNLTKVESEIDRLCQEFKINEDYYGNILIAVTEAINNAIVHGNKEDINKLVELSILQNDNFFRFEIKDQGEGFSYDNLPDPTAPENLEKESGRGVFLMQALADNVEFEDNGGRVILTFQIQND